jgi:hypothetical protein
MPFFKRFKVTKAYFFQFLTISPSNYPTLDGAFKDIRKKFTKFLRRKYLKERIKAGFYVIDPKQSPDGTWNLHIHAILYGRWLDYRLRGKCLKCGQNLLKFNRFSRKFYCANRKCNSEHVIRYKDTRLCREWEDSAGSPAHIYGERVKFTHGAVSYLTKYISVDKNTFLSSEETAKYIFHTRKQKLISAFGMFYGSKFPKRIFYCPDCGSPIHYSFDPEVSAHLIHSVAPRPVQKIL